MGLLTLLCVFVFLSTIAQIQTQQENGNLYHRAAITGCAGDVIELQCEGPANILPLSLSPLALSSPSFSNKILGCCQVTARQGQVCYSAVACNWCFFLFYFFYRHVARAAVECADSAQHLPGSDFNLQSNIKRALSGRSHVGDLNRNLVQGYSCKLQRSPQVLKGTLMWINGLSNNKEPV